MKHIPLTKKDQEISAMFKALAHPARLKIVRLLAERNACICGDIVDELPLAQATVSQHLKVLKEAGLIVGTVEGPSVCYCLNYQTVAALKNGVMEFAEGLTPREVISIKTKGAE